MPGAAGTSLLEGLVTLLVLALALGMAVPRLDRWRQRRSLRGLAYEMAIVVSGLRVAAAASGSHRGVWFDASPEDLRWSLVADGDGDGIGTADLRAGIDPVLRGPYRLTIHQPGLLPGLPTGVDPVDGGSPGRYGVAFGRSGIRSLSPDGGVRAGTLYVRNRRGQAMALRFHGPTGRTTMWWREATEPDWRRLR